MGLKPKVKCRRCGEVFSSMRNRCPNCGTRRVSQSSRSPATTPSSVRGTTSYKKAEANVKWQLAFGLILVAAVILAVITMVTSSLSAEDAVIARATPTPYIPAENAIPTIDPGPTPAPTPEPTVETIRIYSYTNDITDEKKWPMLKYPADAEYKMKLSAMILPQDIQNPVINWSVSDPEIFELSPWVDTNTGAVDPNIMCGKILGTKPGGVQITAECFGKTATITVYCVDG